MTAAALRENVSDYSRFDFVALWPGREKVTEVERSILAALLRNGDRRRILEVGTGFGRLLGTVAELSDEVVAADFDISSLSHLPAPAEGTRTLRVASNVYHLPFVDGAFPCVTMVRLYHHLSSPVLALREIARVLTADGRLLVSYNPKPSIGTLVNDVQRAIHPSPETPFRAITFAKGPVELDPDPFPVYVGGRREFENCIRAAGFTPGFEVVSGLEEYYFMRYVPAKWFVRLGTTFGRAPAFPMRFALVSKRAGGPAPLPQFEELLACPRCRAPQPEWGRGASLSCNECGFEGRLHAGVIDLRFSPDGARRWEARR